MKKKVNTKLIITIALLFLTVAVGGYFISGQRNKPQKVVTPIQTPIQPIKENKDEEIYFSDGYYYHRVIDCPERKRNMLESSTYSKKSCEFYGDKPCPKCCPEEYKEYINKNK